MLLFPAVSWYSYGTEDAMTSQTPDRLTSREVEAMLRIRPRTLRGYLAPGTLPYIQINEKRRLFRRSDIEALLEGKQR
jgi:hypothetical protein